MRGVGLLADRPASGDSEGQSYWALDVDQLYLWDGTAWVTATSLTQAHQGFIEELKHMCLIVVGARTNTMGATGRAAGIGAETLASGTGSINTSVLMRGGWLFSTGGTTAGSAGVRGPLNIAGAHDWTFGAKVILDSNANQNFLMGLTGAGGVFADQNDMIVFRVSGAGNIIGVCDNGGAETTRDSGITPDGATARTLRIEVRSGGTVVRFYVDNAQIGADVTVNIPAVGTHIAGCGITNTDNVDRNFDMAAWIGWREA